MKKMLKISIIITIFFFINNMIIALTSNEIIKLSEAGFSDKTIQILITNDDISMSIDDIIKMKKIGIEEETIQEMIRNEKNKQQKTKEKSEIIKRYEQKKKVNNYKTKTEYKHEEQQTRSRFNAGYCYPPNIKNYSKEFEDFCEGSGTEWEKKNIYGFYISYKHLSNNGFSWSFLGSWGKYEATLKFIGTSVYTNYKYSFGHYGISLLFINEGDYLIYYGIGGNYTSVKNDIQTNHYQVPSMLEETAIPGGHIVIGSNIDISGIEINIEGRYVLTKEIKDDAGNPSHIKGFMGFIGIGLKI